ncbi:acetyl-CoA acyltransferase [Brevibacillus reuszeri]|uniref:Acetyl-CoA acetyltransferase n=1 Tax=Brevibacillus reuszeri TaxID=54915 RepID=A0A0K9YPT3_9BACL|nr:thiolase family protein [Brevibacillus reuszeri]KNB70724.1 acetyl-CoA acetyltransferase [Brevibacillus reuszeri]MED1861261.1 thiolase family protein [Brevibacillus reuszeri]GED69803.1 acetyl-CoA acyltransferase [Brevibacillus reuszeri]
MKSGNDAVIVDAVRSPMGKKNGTLSHIRPDELAAQVLQRLVERNHLDPSLVGDVKMGCVTQVGEQGGNIARLALLLAGFPVEVCGVTSNRACGSSLETLNQAAHEIMAGMSDVVIAAGVESMNRVKMGSDVKAWNPKLSDRYEMIPQGISAERIAQKWGLSRLDLDAYSLRSHEKALKAQAANRFVDEIVPVRVPYLESTMIDFQVDETPRVTSLEKMAALQPAFLSDGIITAGNASPINDGASAVLLMSRQKAEQLGYKPRARIVATAVAGVDPTIMLTGVIPATQKVMKKANLALNDIDLFEVNEAFASVVLAWEKEIKPDPDKVNVNGGAIAIGHPLGASGARLITTLLHELEKREARYGLATLCIMHGMAVATIIEREA